MGNPFKRLLLAAALVVVALLFIWGVVSLALIRFEQGETFAPYSSFRADPLGSRGLYGALDRLPGVATRRHLRPLSKLDAAAGELVLVLGLSADVLERGDANLEKQLLRLAAAGSRVLIAARPPSETFLGTLQQEQESAAVEEAIPTGATDPSLSEGEAGPAPEQTPAADSLAASGLSFAWLPVTAELPQLYTANRAPVETALPEFLDVHTPLVMIDDSGTWLPIYTYGSRMVVAERTWGKGSLVLFVDAFVFSNESLRSGPEAELIAWALGEARQVVFAEAHLGVNESPGLMVLIQRYRMDGILFALFAVAVLVVWKNALPLVPPPPVAAGGVATRDHFSGLVNLLQRHIPLADLPEACHREWRRSLPRFGVPGEEKRAQIRDQVQAEMKRPAKERRPLGLYRKICKILSERTL